MADANDLENKAEPVTESLAGPSDPNPAAARSGLTLANVAHGLKLVALLLFLLPWVTVSCAEHTLVSLSGADLATGSVTVVNPLTGESASPPGTGEADLPVLLGAVLIAAALILGFVLKTRIASIVSTAALAAAAVLISYSVLYRLPERAREGATADSAQGISEAQIAELIRVEVAPGFWLTLGAVLGAILLTFLARREGPPETR